MQKNNIIYLYSTDRQGVVLFGLTSEAKFSSLSKKLSSDQFIIKDGPMVLKDFTLEYVLKSDLAEQEFKLLTKKMLRISTTDLFIEDVDDLKKTLSLFKGETIFERMQTITKSSYIVPDVC